MNERDEKAERVRSQVQALVNKFLPERFDRESLASELWVELFQSGAKLSQKIIRLRCLSEVSKVTREQKALSAYALIKKVDSRERLQDIEAELLKLPELAQRALYLIYWENASVGKLSKELGLSAEEIAKLISQATETLKRNLEEKP